MYRPAKLKALLRGSQRMTASIGSTSIRSALSRAMTRAMRSVAHASVSVAYSLTSSLWSQSENSTRGSKACSLITVLARLAARGDERGHFGWHLSAGEEPLQLGGEFLHVFPVFAQATALPSPKL